MMPVICFQIIQVVNRRESRYNKTSYNFIVVESQVISTWSSCYSIYFCKIFEIFHNKILKTFKTRFSPKTIACHGEMCMIWR